MDANDTQLQQKEVLLEQQNTELRERDTEINRQQRELQTLKVRNDIVLFADTLYLHTLVVLM